MGFQNRMKDPRILMPIGMMCLVFAILGPMLFQPATQFGQKNAPWSSRISVRPVDHVQLICRTAYRSSAPQRELALASYGHRQRHWSGRRERRR